MSNSVTLWTVAFQAPLSMRFSRQQYWTGMQCPPPPYVYLLYIGSNSLSFAMFQRVGYVWSLRWSSLPILMSISGPLTLPQVVSLPSISFQAVVQDIALFLHFGSPALKRCKGASRQGGDLVPFQVSFTAQLHSDVLIMSLLLLLFSCSVVSDSLRPYGLQHSRLPCPSPSPGACSDSHILNW